MLQLAIIGLSLLIGVCHSSMYGNQAIPAAIYSRHSVDIRPIGNTFSKRMPSDVIEVNGKQTSFVFILKSASSAINVVHKHDSAKVPPVQQSNSVDEPHILSHTVKKPIIQEVREVISPYRRVIQEIKPVYQEVKTVVNRKSGSPVSETNHQSNYKTNNIPRKPLLESPKILNSEACLTVQDTIDYSLYTGTSDYDMKYISPNDQQINNHLIDSKNLLYQMIRLYKDK